MLVGDFLIFRLCEIQLGAECLLGEHEPLKPNILFTKGHALKEMFENLDPYLFSWPRNIAINFAFKNENRRCSVAS